MQNMALHRKQKYGATIEEIFGIILVAKHDANLEAEIGTYLEVKYGAKSDAKVVAKMDAILGANMVLLRMQIWH